MTVGGPFTFKVISDLGSKGLCGVDAPNGASEPPACLGEVEGVLKRKPRKHLRREDVRKFHDEGLEDGDVSALQVPNCRRYVSLPSGDGDVCSHVESDASLWRQVQSRLGRAVRGLCGANAAHVYPRSVRGDVARGCGASGDLLGDVLRDGLAGVRLSVRHASVSCEVARRRCCDSYPKAFLGRDTPSLSPPPRNRPRRRRKGTKGTRTLRFLGTETKRRVLSRYDLSTRLTPSRTDPHLPPQPPSTRR